MSQQVVVWRCRDRVLDCGRPALIMGIVNVTPDSFSDGGRYACTDLAVAHSLQLVEQGADLLDIGGESSRPGAQSISLEEELGRVVPVVRALLQQTTVPISVDTTKAEVARQTLDLGAHIINDITALLGDPQMGEIVHSFQAGVVLMHMQGTPATMQLNPTYDDVVHEVRAFLEARLQAVRNLGIADDRVALDPGIGFGKTAEHNWELLRRLHELQSLGRPVCLGVSRKGLLRGSRNRPAERRMAASLAVACFALARGTAQILRVHDVAETRDALEVYRALQNDTQYEPEA
jgi:dihydropteroate synthase